MTLIIEIAPGSLLRSVSLSLSLSSSHALSYIYASLFLRLSTVPTGAARFVLVPRFQHGDGDGLREKRLS